MKCWRKTVLWIGCTLCVLIASAFVVSVGRFVGIQVPYGPCVFLDDGAIMVLMGDPMTDWAIADRSLTGQTHWNKWGAGKNFVNLPLYALFAAAAIPTLLVWRFWPKSPKPGHCRCGYNLTGLPEPRCPECGQPFEAKGDAP